MPFDDFEKTAYENHYALFQHYSSLLFRARIAMVTLVLLIFVFIIEKSTIPLSEGGDPLEKINEIFGINAIAVTAYAAALLLPILFGMETAYLKRLKEVKEGAAAFEIINNKKYKVNYKEILPPLYLSEYDRTGFTKWIFRILYLMFYIILNTLFGYLAVPGDLSIFACILLILIPPLLIFFAWMFRKILKYLDRKRNESQNNPN